MHSMDAPPTPTPLDLAEIPITRSTAKLIRAADGRLPEEAYETTHEITGVDGVRHEIRITGDAKLGLPYGADIDVLMALFRLIDDHQLLDGRFPDPSVSMVTTALGLPMSGQRAARIRGALKRLAHVRIETRTIRDLSGFALDVQSGRVTPMLPGRSLYRSEKEQVQHLLSYSWRHDETHGKDGEDHIEELAVNPIWVQQAIGGWVNWVAIDTHQSLSGPVAKRLYQMFTSFAARGDATPWSLDLDYLTQACALTRGRRASDRRSSISDALDDLRDHDIVGEHRWDSPKRGQYVFHVTPGPDLDRARWMRGIGLLDLASVRTQMMVLAQFGIGPHQARPLIYEAQNRVHEVLRYALYLRDVAPGRIRKSWSGWILNAIRNEWTFEGDKEFRVWLRRQKNDRPARTGAPRRRKSSVPASSTRTTTPDAIATELAAEASTPSVEVVRCHVEAEEPAAREAWDAVRTRLQDDLPAPATVALRHLAPEAIDGDTLVCCANSDLYAHMLRPHTSAIGRVLGDASEGAVSRVRIRMVPRTNA